MCSCGVIEVDEGVADAQRAGHVLGHGTHTAALGGVVAASQIAHPHFAGVMGLRLGNLAGDEGLYASGHGGLEVRLGAARTPGHGLHRPGRVASQRHGAAQALLGVAGQFAQRGTGGGADEAQVLFAKPAKAWGLRRCGNIGNAHCGCSLGWQRLQAQHPGQLRVVAQIGVGIQRQVVGQQVDVVGDQGFDALVHPAGDATILPAPEQAVVNQQRIGTGGNRRLNQCQTGRDSGDQMGHTGAALHLQAVGAVVPKLRG